MLEKTTGCDLGESTEKPACSIGIMAYNEETNVGRLLDELLCQDIDCCRVEEIIVVASGCTDNTETVVREIASREPRIKLIGQPAREGKASAINLFLRHTRSEIVVLESADTMPASMTIERLLAPFTDPRIGMTGGRPTPINDPNTFMGFAAQLLWNLHHRVALEQPKLGELVAFRRIFYRIPDNSAVDEASIETLIRGQGYGLHYVPEAVVYNRGPSTVNDFLKQRRRIHAGHLKMRHEQGYAVSTMGGGRILRALLRDWQWNRRWFIWTPLVIALELYGRTLGWLDLRFKKRDHAVWDIAHSTKTEIAPKPI